MGHVQPTPAPPIMHLISRTHIISNFLLITFIPLLIHTLLTTLIPPPIIPMLPLLLYPPTYNIHSLPKARPITPNDCPMVPTTTVTMAEDR